MKGLCILGSTGSIGLSTLDVAARHPERYKIIAITANTNIDVLYQQCIQYRPNYAVVADAKAGKIFADKIESSNLDITVLTGEKALAEVASMDEVDSVMAAIVGAAGLLPTLAAAKTGKTILLANKEALVMSGDIFLQAVSASGANLLPIDSEHNAIFQCMPASYETAHVAKAVRRVLLTASGGPFRETPVEQLSRVTPEQAIAHPNWDMGKKISVDSATMMNKGLELIEACLLFSLPSKKIQVVIHPQSVIHSMVDYIDGTVLAQLGNPDMRIPIAHAMAWPERFESGAEPLDIFEVQKLDFQKPDLKRFPCLYLANQAIDAGGVMPTVLNAANEIAVEAFLQEQIRFTEIPVVIEKCMQKFDPEKAGNLEMVLQINESARTHAMDFVRQIGK